MIRDIVWVLSPDNGTIDDVVLKMREIAGRLLEGKTISLEFLVPPNRQPIALEVRRNLFLFYKECLNNIMRHAGATSVQIRLRVTGEGMELFIADDGKGFEVKGDHPGLGLANLRRRATEMKARLQIESNPAGGTAISLQIRLT
jgi:signal transduction histidine kinase